MATPDDAGGVGGDPGPPSGLPEQAAEAASRAAEVLNDVLGIPGEILRGIFGCLPWESACEPAQQVATNGAVLLPDLVGVLV